MHRLYKSIDSLFSTLQFIDAHWETDFDNRMAFMKYSLEFVDVEGMQQAYEKRMDRLPELWEEFESAMSL